MAYVDGFNLYFGMRKAWGRRFLWLNIQKMIEVLLKPDQQLLGTKYFTSRISGQAGKQKRQSTYIEALETLSNFSIYYGRYQHNPHECNKCGFADLVPNEKKTDVNIAVQILTDAFQDAYDMALLVSADGDLVPAVEAVKRLFPLKRLVIAFPPKRYSVELASIADAYFTILKHAVKPSLFSPVVVSRSGFPLNCPDSWK